MSDLKKILSDRGVSIGVKGTKGKPAGKKLAADLLGSKPDDHIQILTNHGAHLVLSAVKEGRMAWKGFNEYLVEEAMKMAAEVGARHQRQLDALVGRIEELEQKMIAAPATTDGDGEAIAEHSGTQETAAN